jgi:hypothetical protein
MTPLARLPKVRSEVLSPDLTMATDLRDAGDDGLRAMERAFESLLLQPLTAAVEAGELRERQVGGWAA